MSKLDPPRPAAGAPVVIAAAAQVLEGITELRWAYVFGSLARGTDFRDLDLAVMPQPGALRGVAFGGLVAALERAAGLPVDLIDLRTADLPMQARVVREGRRALDREPRSRQLWEVDVTRRWLDIKPWLELQDRLLRRRLESTIGK